MIKFSDAERAQRFAVGDLVSHNGGLIEAASQRRIIEVIGYDPDGGVQYRLVSRAGANCGYAYDDELDPWPEGHVELPILSPRIV